MKETECIFPISLLEEVYTLINKQGITVLRYKDLEKSGLRHPSKYRYIDEYIKFSYGNVTPITAIKALLKLVSVRKPNLPFAGLISQKLIRNTKKPVIIMQHDADNIPSRTLDVMKLEKKSNILSSSYFFVEHAEGKDYFYDKKELRDLEADGFEIGYHLNAYERAEYNLKTANKLVEQDIEQLKLDFNITSYVPHGGISSKDGLNNHDYPQVGVLNDLLWAYNGSCILKEYTWSDGGIRTNKFTPIDPRVFIKRLKDDTRAVMLIHPQYYGEKLRPDWQTLDISKKKWWRDLWGL